MANDADDWPRQLDQVRLVRCVWILREDLQRKPRSATFQHRVLELVDVPALAVVGVGAAAPKDDDEEGR